ncbi:replication initiator protein A [Bacillus safensis]|uniref:Replication initiator A N-terminal domain-containing protein n=1 Tax=Bacillus safensis TaxID=561879 RepID=A0A1L6ZPE7_BACIA|nr:replication initiator protein A [Bacillus safensis]APT48375.1 hypothetical protein BSA145_21165 [Bacillus safensis]
MEKESKYFNIYEEYGLKYVQLPKVLLTSEKYKHLSSSAKIAWAILRERFSLSKKNGWIEEETGRIYFSFSNETLMDILNVKGKSTIVKIKKELMDVDLLEQKRVGLNSTNRLYLLKPEVTKEDIYQIDSLESIPEPKPNPFLNNGSPETGLPAKTLDTQGSPETGLPEVQKLNSIKTDSIKTDLDIKDTYKETNISVDLETQQDRLLRNSLRHDIPKTIFETLDIFSSSFKEMYERFGIIIRAKKIVEEEFGECILFEQKNIEDQINMCLLKCIRIERTKEVENSNNYLYMSMKKTFEQLIAEKSRIASNQKFHNPFE